MDFALFTDTRATDSSGAFFWRLGKPSPPPAAGGNTKRSSLRVVYVMLSACFSASHRPPIPVPLPIHHADPCALPLCSFSFPQKNKIRAQVLVSTNENVDLIPGRPVQQGTCALVYNVASGRVVSRAGGCR